jgi:hypothetical protein
MRSLRRLVGAFISSILFTPTVSAESEAARLVELDAFWAEVSHSVEKGNFAAYSATCDPEAVLVSGTKKVSYPLSKALVRWKKEFDDTKSGKRESSVAFRFSQRLGDESTAHETGIFLYSFKQGDGEVQNEYVHLEALLVKKEGKWKTVMEYQKAPATEEEWKALE